MGFLGGVNFQILVAFVCQLFPTATPARLLAHFFELYRAWKWPTEIRLCHPYPVSGLDLEQFGDRRSPGELMPIITPAYPCRNSSYNVSKATLAIMSEEFALAEKVCKGIRRQTSESDFSIWAPLFEKTEFFCRYQNYIAVRATGSDDDALARWGGWIESRLRKLVDEVQRFPIRQIYPYPKKFTLERDPLAAYWYIGILRHPIFSERSGHSMDLSSAVSLWLNNVKRWDTRSEDMEASVSVMQWKDLPDDKELFPIGKTADKAKHKKWMQLTTLEQNRIKSQSEGTKAAPVVEEEEKVIKEEKEEETKMQAMLGKRIRDGKEANEALKKVSKITSLFDLPVVNGIDTTTPFRYI